MNCKIIFEKYNSIIKQIKNQEESIKINNDSPLLNSYLRENFNKLIIEKNQLKKELKQCQDKLNYQFN